MIKLIKDYVAYNSWANKKLFGLTDQLQGADFDRELVSSFPTIRKTIVHIWDAESIWLSRLKGSSPIQWPSNNLDRSLPFIEPAIANSEVYRDYVNKKEASWFDAPCSYSTAEGTIFMKRYGELIMHTMNHSTFHRGQLITMFRQLGLTELSSTDYITWVNTKGETENELSAIYGG
ncbi:MAG: putative damage-inducible protein DinB [Limisphaerales bacterium]|jgi:uncharacterized damage-inducible protein DinB